jgi:hypothetical protein
MSPKHLFIAAVLVHATGCESTIETPLEPIGRLTSPELDAQTRATLAHMAVQAEYAQTGSDEALYWLLFHGVRSGMDRAEIEKVLGMRLDPAEPPEGFSTPFGVRDTDEFYQVGPTEQGWSCLFHFRAGELLNYHTLPPEPASE